MSAGDFGTIIQIGDILVSEDVVCEFFACDYEACKGACCIEGDSGAPLDEGELESLEENYPSYSGFMSEAGKKRVAEVGFFEVDRDGDLVTPCVPGSRECAFCVMRRIGEASAPGTGDLGRGSLRGNLPDSGGSGSAWCAIELSGCRKPLSCALYPIRVTKMTGGGEALNLHRWKICEAAREKGRREGIRAYQFLKAPIIRAYGEEFYDALDAAARHIL